MDYKTKPISRADIRVLANAVRSVFKCRNKYYFDVVKAFDMMHTYFPEVMTLVVEENELPPEIPACCEPEDSNCYIIKVKEPVYEGAVNGIGGYRAHILHEMSHAILCLIGFTPVEETPYKNFELNPFESMEWQAKALCGEILVPYEATKGLPVRDIMRRCKVSYDCATLRFNEFKKKKESGFEILDEAAFLNLKNSLNSSLNETTNQISAL